MIKTSPADKAPTIEEAKAKTQLLIADLEKVGLSYANPILVGNEISQALELRKAGLGL